MSVLQSLDLVPCGVTGRYKASYPIQDRLDLDPSNNFPSVDPDVVKLLLELRDLIFEFLARGDGTLQLCGRFAELVSLMGFVGIEPMYYPGIVACLFVLLLIEPFDFFVLSLNLVLCCL